MLVDQTVAARLLDPFKSNNPNIPGNFPLPVPCYISVVIKSMNSLSKAQKEMCSRGMITENENDTMAVFKMINVPNDEWSIFKMHRIEGPFAFVYWDQTRNRLWFGRDRLGRRSLVCAYNAENHCLAVSSVPYKSQYFDCSNWREIPNQGLFCLNLGDGILNLYSWRNILSHNKIRIDPHRKEEQKQNDDKGSTDDSPLIYSKLRIHSVFRMDPKLSVSTLLSSITYDQVLNGFLNVLSNALRRRVLVPESSKLLRHRYVLEEPDKWMKSVHCSSDLKDQWKVQQNKEAQLKEASIGILYSGGIDSQILAALCDRFMPKGEVIDLINVVCGDDAMSSPDRLTAINGMLELRECINPQREWRLITVDIGYQDIVNAKDHILSLVFPCSTIMDFNIGNILWFGARGIGEVRVDGRYQWVSSPLVRYSEADIVLKQQYDERISALGIDKMIAEQLETEFPAQNALKMKSKTDSMESEGNQPKVDKQEVNGDDKTHEVTAKKRKQVLKQRKYALNKLKKKRAKEIRREIIDEVKQEIYGRHDASESEKKETEHNDNVEDQTYYISASRVLLLGFGSDELLGGYGRHRTSFRMKGENGLKQELNRDFSRLWRRNLGRDDRLISDHGREARWPFLDEQFVSFVKQLPLKFICDLNMPIGIGDKKILRDCAKRIGLKHSWSLVKRAIQFGSRIANSKVAGYVNVDSKLSVDDLINTEIYNSIESAHVVNSTVTKKWNKMTGKRGFE